MYLQQIKSILLVSSKLNIWVMQNRSFVPKSEPPLFYNHKCFFLYLFVMMIAFEYLFLLQHYKFTLDDFRKSGKELYCQILGLNLKFHFFIIWYGIMEYYFDSKLILRNHSKHLMIYFAKPFNHLECQIMVKFNSVANPIIK